jgi:hypothetical protein
MGQTQPEDYGKTLDDPAFRQYLASLAASPSGRMTFFAKLSDPGIGPSEGIDVHIMLWKETWKELYWLMIRRKVKSPDMMIAILVKASYDHAVTRDASDAEEKTKRKTAQEKAQSAGEEAPEADLATEGHPLQMRDLR